MGRLPFLPRSGKTAEAAVEIAVPADCPPMRLDRFVAARLPGASRRRLRECAAAVHLNGRPARLSTMVQAGDVVTLPESLVQPPALEPQPDVSLAVLYEDLDLVAVDKRAGMSSVAQRGSSDVSVAAFLAGRYPEVASVGPPLEGGLVHRLDRETSGVLIAARTPHAYTELRRQFAEHTVEKQYVALVHGDVAAPGFVATPIAHDRRHPSRMRVCADLQAAEHLRARPAETHFVPELRYGAATLLRVTIRTGVMHQIRVHLASIGHPVVGDRTYGTEAGDFEAPRHCLHAARVVLRHPRSGAQLSIESQLPADLEAVLARATAHRTRGPRE